jgi:hypothetical protein
MKLKFNNNMSNKDNKKRFIFENNKTILDVTTEKRHVYEDLFLIVDESGRLRNIGDNRHHAVNGFYMSSAQEVAEKLFGTVIKYQHIITIAH